LLRKWLAAVAKVWGLEAAFLVAQTHAWPAIDQNSVMACLLSMLTNIPMR